MSSRYCVIPPGKPHDHDSHAYRYTYTEHGCTGFHTCLRILLDGLRNVTPGQRAYVEAEGEPPYPTIGECWNGLAFCWMCGWFRWQAPWTDTPHRPRTATVATTTIASP